jgi:hypothetical protein
MFIDVDLHLPSIRLVQKLKSIAEVIHCEQERGSLTSYTPDPLKWWVSVGTKIAALAGAGKLLVISSSNRMVIVFLYQAQFIFCCWHQQQE